MSINSKKICLLTTTHLCKNPRLVKEMEALTKSGYNVQVIYWHFNANYIAFDKEIEQKYPEVNFIAIKWLSLKNSERFLYTLLSKFLLLLNKKLKISILPEQQLWPGYLKLKQVTSRIKANLYHAHNPGAMAVAVNVAHKNLAKAGFDAEDYHRGESTDENDFDVKLLVKLENKYIPKLNLFITSSPLIQKQYHKHYPNIPSICILNVFPKSNFKSLENLENNYLNCVWFSQIVGLNRGLKEIISAINNISKSIRLDIIGTASEEVKKELLGELTNNRHQINFLGTFSTTLLDIKLTQYDIGIASEINDRPNREYCLTNKLFAYIKAGLALLISDTKAQQQFVQSLPTEIGYLYNLNQTNTITEALEKWNNNPTILLAHKTNSTELSTTLNWENEQIKLIELINQTI